MKRIAVLGSTGSIGKSTLKVVDGALDRLSVLGLSAHQRVDELAEQAREHLPQLVVVTDPAQAERVSAADFPRSAEILLGPDSLVDLVAHPAVDIVVAGIVGSVGLQSTWAALEHGKTVALANKESLVMAGPLITELATRREAQILPIDSEHSAIFQALQGGRREEVARVLLTASGGPFRDYSSEALLQVTVDDALSHPTWDMGPKITVDSATMMNKALELIEARWLFDLDVDQLDVVIHRQSIVHSMVEYRDGSTLAQLSPPDMCLPIQFALDYPERRVGVAKRMDWESHVQLDFEPACRQRFPAIELGLECAKQGGTSGAVLNAANEAAVALFLEGELHFTEIVPACRSVLESHPFEPNPSLEQVFEIDAWAREEVSRWVCA